MRSDLKTWARLVETAETLTELDFNRSKQLVRTDWGRKTDAILNWLAGQGFRRLGVGHAGSVWTDDYRAVVKIFDNDRCYAQFAEFCRANRGDPHLPRISRIFPLQSANSGIVFMELLQPFENYQMASAIDEYFISARAALRIPDYIESPTQSRFAHKYPSIATTLRKIARGLPDNTCHADLHSSNIMLRGTTIVLVDPVVG